MKYSRLIIFSLIVLLKASLAQAYPPQDAPIRVAVLLDASNFVLSIRGNYSVTDSKSGQELEHGRTLRSAMIKAADGGIQIGDKKYHSSRIQIFPQKDVTVFINDKEQKYRGHIDIIRMPNNKILVVNTLDLETYTKGVLYHEVTNRWPIEAIKAQAVATRSYALYQATLNKDKDYDVTSDIFSQVYGGKSAERYRTNVATNRTRGQVLIYAGEILPAYFHSNCGGHTENASELWDQNLKPLQGVVCNFCKFSPGSMWQKNFRSKDIQDKLNQNGYHLGPILDIKILERNESGRIRNLEITTRDGKKINILGKKLREIIGPNIIRSNNYEIYMKGYYFDIIGRGWGHGVGMCQWGANEMSRQRYKYDEILQYYYPGAEIVALEEPKEGGRDNFWNGI